MGRLACVSLCSNHAEGVVWLSVPVPEPRVARFEKMAFGMFVHWGLYSLLERGEWILHHSRMPEAEYRKLTERFTAENFDARALARLAKRAGMKYITLTARHHDGFSLYDTRGLSTYDAPHSAAGRDLIAEFVEGCRAEGIVPFLYHTTLDWSFGTADCDEATFNEYLDYLHASVEILCREYGPLGGLWFDGNWSREADWKEDRLYGMIRKYQPDCMIINNTGLGHRGVWGHPEIDSTTFEQGLPQPIDRRGWPKYVAAEMCQTLNSHWGVAREDVSYISPVQVIENLVHCRGVGANYLLNVGLLADGGIPNYEAAILERVGDWVAMQGDVIYEGKPVRCHAAGRDVVLEANGKMYWFVFDLGIRGDASVTVGLSGPGFRTLSGLDRRIAEVRWLDSGEKLQFVQHPDGGFATVRLTGFPYGTNWVVRVAEITFE